MRAVAAGARGILCDKPFVTTLAREMPRSMPAGGPGWPSLRYRVALGRGIPLAGAAGAGRRGRHGAGDPRLRSSNLIFHGCHWYDIALMLVGDPEPSWVSGRVSDVSAREPDEGRRLDPPGRAWVGLDNGATLALLPERRGVPSPFSAAPGGWRSSMMRGRHICGRRAQIPPGKPWPRRRSAWRCRGRPIRGRAGGRSCATWCARCATRPPPGATCRRFAGQRRSASPFMNRTPQVVRPSASPSPIVPAASIRGAWGND